MFIVLIGFTLIEPVDYVVEAVSTVLVFKGLDDPCGDCVYSNLAFQINNTMIILKGYFNKELIDSYIRGLIGYLVKNYGYTLSAAIKQVAITYSIGDIASYQHKFFYDVYSKPENAWKLFLFRGGWCIGASMRAGYILGLYNTSSLLIVSNYTNPLHSILLVETTNSLGITGKTVFFNNTRFIEYINYPYISIPLDKDIVYVLEFSPPSIRG